LAASRNVSYENTAGTPAACSAAIAPGRSRGLRIASMRASSGCAVARTPASSAEVDAALATRSASSIEALPVPPAAVRMSSARACVSAALLSSSQRLKPPVPGGSGCACSQSKLVLA
jgi:hypothetical protein